MTSVLWFLRDCKIKNTQVAVHGDDSSDEDGGRSKKQIGEKMAKKNKRPAPVMANNPPQKFEFNPDYSLIKKDLRRIGILAGFFIAVLVALSFILK
jgi:hypothetical protein